MLRYHVLCPLKCWPACRLTRVFHLIYKVCLCYSIRLVFNWMYSYVCWNVSSVCISFPLECQHAECTSTVITDSIKMHLIAELIALQDTWMYANHPVLTKFQNDATLSSYKNYLILHKIHLTSREIPILCSALWTVLVFIRYAHCLMQEGNQNWHLLKINLFAFHPCFLWLSTNWSGLLGL